jgi:ubiquinone/menaquinone biosynthesis C-methylase UbiE
MESALAEIARTVRPGGQVIVTDFHPGALDRGWKRTFRNHGQLYEIETYPYTTTRLLYCARRCGLVLEDLLEPCFDEPERPIFSGAGKQDLYQQVRGVPAVFLARWRRP